MKVLNAFSLNMLPAGFCGEVAIRQLNSADDAAEFLDCCEGYDADAAESCIGHADTAFILSSLLGRELKMNRASVTLALFERALVCQYQGPRLPEGATQLPEGAEFKFIIVQPLERRNDDKIREEYLPSLRRLDAYEDMSPADLRRLADEREEKEREVVEHFSPGDDDGGSGFGRNIGND